MKLRLSLLLLALSLLSAACGSATEEADPAGELPEGPALVMVYTDS